MCVPKNGIGHRYKVPVTVHGSRISTHVVSHPDDLLQIERFGSAQAILTAVSTSASKRSSSEEFGATRSADPARGTDLERRIANVGCIPQHQEA